MKGCARSWHVQLMRLSKLLLVIGLGGVASAANEADAVRDTLRRFNEALSSAELQPLRAFFTSDADYRDGAGDLQGPDALASLLAGRQVWSERTPPALQEVSIRLAGLSVAFVDAQLVQFGSVIVKSGIPVVLLLEKEGGTWKIASWRMAAYPMLYTPR